MSASAFTESPSYETDRNDVRCSILRTTLRNAYCGTPARLRFRQCVVAGARLCTSSTFEYCAPCHPCPETLRNETSNFRTLNKHDKQRVLPNVRVDRAVLTPYFGRCDRGDESRDRWSSTLRRRRRTRILSISIRITISSIIASNSVVTEPHNVRQIYHHRPHTRHRCECHSQPSYI